MRAINIRGVFGYFLSEGFDIAIDLRVESVELHKFLVDEVWELLFLESKGAGESVGIVCI